MRQCQNCGSTITCGCQDRVATDGKKVCSSCIVSYEQKLNEQRQQAIIINAQLTDNEKPAGT